MGTKSPRQYTQEFKQQAVQLSNDLKSGPKAAAQLGVPKSSIYTWRNQAKAGDLAMGKNGAIAMKSETPSSLEQENRRLQRELAELKKVNHILKQAAAFFSQDHLK